MPQSYRIKCTARLVNLFIAHLATLYFIVYSRNVGRYGNNKF